MDKNTELTTNTDEFILESKKQCDAFIATMSTLSALLQKESAVNIEIAAAAIATAITAATAVANAATDTSTAAKKRKASTPAAPKVNIPHACISLPFSEQRLNKPLIIYFT